MICYFQIECIDGCTEDLQSHYKDHQLRQDAIFTEPMKKLKSHFLCVVNYDVCISGFTIFTNMLMFT